MKWIIRQMCLWDYVIRQTFWAFICAVSPNLPLWDVRRLSGLWLQPTLDRIKIEWYRKQSLVVGIQFALRLMKCTPTPLTRFTFERFDYRAKTRLVEGFLCFTLSLSYTLHFHTSYIFLSAYTKIKQSSFLSFLLLRNSCWKTVLSSIFKHFL